MRDERRLPAPTGTDVRRAGHLRDHRPERRHLRWRPPHRSHRGYHSARQRPAGPQASITLY